MTLSTLWVIAFGLSMDAFAVAISKGLAMRAFRCKLALAIALCFGCFQGVMPLIGYLLGAQFSHFIEDWDHWVAFVLLALIRINMLREGVSEDDESVDDVISAKHLLSLGIATSIVAMAVGISFAFLTVDIGPAALIIAITTFVLSFLGVKGGHFLGRRFKSRAEIFGGLVLLAIAVKILHDHGVF